MTTGDARRIAQDFLDRQGDATVAGDVDETLAWCDLPMTLETMRGRTVVTTTEGMRAICVAFVEDLRNGQITHMVRSCLEAEFEDANTICATYETRYVRKGNLRAEDPYPGYVVLRRGPDRWRISSMQFAVTGESPANTTLRRLRRPPA
ncbi:hypothetical protein KUV73_13505 [Mameliella alba]|nr:hypothetical protein [Mameliella alba]MBY6170370.1 hypothetical protein [Mameliella alba]MBY6175388.1 hypothetical protein [Mameliella alba]